MTSGFLPDLFNLRNVELAYINKVAGDGGCGHDRANEMRAAVAPLAALEITVGGAGAAFVRRQYVGIHADAHAAARIAPFESGLRKDLVEAFFFSSGFDAAGAGNDEGLFDIFRDLLAGHELRCGAEIVQTRICAGADEDAVHGNI